MNEGQLGRVRKICFQYPGTEERLSHGEPTFFAGKRVFVMFAEDHHEDGRIAVWLPSPDGMQSILIQSDPETYFRPPYVGHRGWIGVILDRVSDKDLAFHIQDGWRLVATKTLQKAFDEKGK